MKKYIFILLILVTMCGCKNANCNNNATPTDAVKNEMDEDSRNLDGNDGSEKDSSVNETTTEEIDNSVLRDYSSISSRKYSWYVVRNHDHKISGCDRNVAIEAYSAYYADKEAETQGRKVMYLTFDCGYENGYTGRILDILKEHGAKACFFVTMTYIRDNPDLVKRMKEEGHLVGNHTVTHPSMPDLSVSEQREEIKKCADYMKEETGYSMDMYFRPPSGEYSEQTLLLAKDMGYKTIFWSMAYLDYDVNNQPGKEYVINHFNKYYHPGAVVLMHNVSSSNAEALDAVLNNLTDLGFEFVTIDNVKD